VEGGEEGGEVNPREFSVLRIPKCDDLVETNDAKLSKNISVKEQRDNYNMSAIFVRNKTHRKISSCSW